MKNHYRIVGNDVYISINTKNGIVETVVELADLPIAQAYPKTWYLNSGYVAGDYRVDGKRVMVRLHRSIMLAPDELIVDHRDCNRLNNRRKNFRLGTSALNKQNVNRPNRDNTSGVRGVSWRESSGKWRAYSRFNGKHEHIGWFTNIEDAEAAVKEFRKNNMPFSQEAMAKGS